ncbi:hypothetical protein niasHS_005219 [Heterodera schachtii]|uniref:Uncharacterized protein n=1 Tax=Heterodera schachtii TaxID=97005 RepID=A0ABD2JVE5_HETSC
MIFFAAPRPMVAAAILFIPFAFFPHFCGGALKCAKGSIGVVNTTLVVKECANEVSIYCFKVNCTAVSTNEHQLTMSCADNDNKKEAKEWVMEKIVNNSKATDWSCDVKFGKLNEYVPFPLPGESMTPATDDAADGPKVFVPMAFVLPLVFVAYFCVLPIF